MELTIILVAVLLLGVGIYFAKKKPKVEQPTKPKVDNAPTTKDRVVTLYGAEGYELTKDILIFRDIDGDKITHVRFHGDMTKVYVDDKHTINYVSGTELPIDFKLYVKFSEHIDSVSIKYEVKSNNLWSK